jgi:hypothetical protein
MYLFNTLILPKIEYRAQAVLFTDREAGDLTKPF